MESLDIWTCREADHLKKKEEKTSHAPYPSHVTHSVTPSQTPLPPPRAWRTLWTAHSVFLWQRYAGLSMAAYLHCFSDCYRICHSQQGLHTMSRCYGNQSNN